MRYLVLVPVGASLVLSAIISQGIQDHILLWWHQTRETQTRYWVPMDENLKRILKAEMEAALSGIEIVKD